MWSESIDVATIVGNSRERAAQSRILAKQLKAATESTIELILSSQAAISDSDRFICTNWNYFPCPNGFGEAGGEQDSSDLRGAENILSLPIR